MTSDSTLTYLDQSRRGDERAIKLLVESHQKLVFSIAWKVLGNKEDAEDAAQETFIRCFRNLGKFKGESAFGTWLCSIAYRAAIDLFNKRKNRNSKIVSMEHDIHQLKAPFENPEKGTESREIKLILKTAIDALPSADALMIMLYYYWDMPLEEIGKIVQISENNAKVRLHRIRIKLHALLKELKETQSV